LRNFDLVAVDSGIDEAQLEKLQECSVPFEIVLFRSYLQGAEHEHPVYDGEVTDDEARKVLAW
jgi:hypothetical protein